MTASKSFHGGHNRGDVADTNLGGFVVGDLFDYVRWRMRARDTTNRAEHLSEHLAKHDVVRQCRSGLRSDLVIPYVALYAKKNDRQEEDSGI